MNTRFKVLSGMVLAVVAARWLPHPPNFTPVTALALFGGATFANKRVAFFVPLLGLFLSDLVLGFYSITPVVYAAFALIVVLGRWLRRDKSVSHVAFAAIASALVLFLVTNFGLWAMGELYPKTLGGLGECYIAAIPFFRNTLVSSLVYSALLFGGLTLAEKHWPMLADASAPVAA